MSTGSVGIEIDMNGVHVEGIFIQRPRRLSPSQWLSFWDKVAMLDQASASGSPSGGPRLMGRRPESSPGPGNRR
jgi:hypothetical protein